MTRPRTIPVTSCALTGMVHTKATSSASTKRRTTAIRKPSTGWEVEISCILAAPILGARASPDHRDPANRPATHKTRVTLNAVGSFNCQGDVGKDQGNPFVNFEKTPSVGVAFVSDRT